MNAAAVLRAAAEGLRPDAPLQVSEWANRYLVLAKRSSAEPGAYRWERTPYVREPMDTLSLDSPTQTTVLMWASQVGKSTIGLAWAGYIIDHDPGPTMIVQPTGSVARRFSQTRLDPVIQASPRLRAKIPPARQRDSRNTVEMKLFPGGSIIITAPTGPRLREAAIRSLILDEVDGYPADVSGEGSPLELVQVRQRTFPRRKKLVISTPTVAGRSLIEDLFLASDQRRYFVPCPHCGLAQPLEFARLTWTALGRPPEAAVYLCAGCAAPIPEHMKTAMLSQGEWRATADAAAGMRGYHLNALYAPIGWLSWGEIARAWTDAQGDPIKMRSVVNTVLAETWRDRGEAPAWERLMRRRGLYAAGTVPPGALVLTAGVDVQKIKLVLEVVGWGRRHRSWSITWQEFEGDTSDLSPGGPWAALLAYLARGFPDGAGRVRPVSMTAVDSGFIAPVVYDVVRRHRLTMMAITGKAIPVVLSSGPVVDVTPRGTKAKTMAVKVWHVGDDATKQEFYGWLNLEAPVDGSAPPPGWCEFPADYTPVYFQGITAEELLEHRSRLRPGAKLKREWVVLKGRANHLLDARRYARAAAERLLSRLTETQWVEMETLLAPTRAAAVDDEADAPPEGAEVILV